MELTPETPVQYLKGVGPHLSRLLDKLGVSTVGDLLEWYPRAYEDRRKARNISSLVPGEIVCLRAIIVSVGSNPMGKSHQRMHTVVVRDTTGTISCRFFRIPHKGFFSRFQPNMEVDVIGKVTLSRGRNEFHHPDIRDAAEDGDAIVGLVPIYSVCEGLSSRRLGALIETALTQLQGKMPDPIPEFVRREHAFPRREESVRAVHRPDVNAGPEFSQMASKFHQRIIFDEFFRLQLQLVARRNDFRRISAHALLEVGDLLQRCRTNLPFELTLSQDRVFEEIAKDLRQNRPMNRLIQGDVGSGKTIVSLLSALLVASNGRQTAIMVPTEILAEQHARNARDLLEPLGLRVDRLTSRLTGSERQDLLDKLATGAIHVLVGTHALIQPDVKFQSLALVVIDEQHRFGVHQRELLFNKGLGSDGDRVYHPHLLVMTATPIPQTLAMTIYGDLDVSVLDELPKGRRPIVTRIVTEGQRHLVFDFLASQIKKGRQAYVIYPLVDESEKVDLQSALGAFEKLKSFLPKLRWGLLHGRMSFQEKDQIMERFRSHELDVLVSTTAIEVGIDVSNATMIVIEHSERFGLSQLHQLRGRVGRGHEKSYCVLMCGRGVSEAAMTRLSVLAETTDGFKIAERDLELRGPGELLGVRQSGLVDFKMADLTRHSELLLAARRAAFETVATRCQEES